LTGEHPLRHAEINTDNSNKYKKWEMKQKHRGTTEQRKHKGTDALHDSQESKKWNANQSVATREQVSTWDHPSSDIYIGHCGLNDYFAPIQLGIEDPNCNCGD
jgi:hypothetical protein